MEAMQGHDTTCYNICKQNNTDAGKVGRWTAEQFYTAIEQHNNELAERERALKAAKK